MYRPNTAPLADTYIDVFSTNMVAILNKINLEHKTGIIMGDMNLDLLKIQKHSKSNEYLDHIFASGFLPVITRPTRVTCHSATLIGSF